ncbi:dihydroorotase [Candidatus Nitrosocosmicus franklandus]|uniref:L-hydantoinase n=1 Tax=Candidatus Nitrosocosmicus franklandianus TaxID=1798806 RepID=A0A484ID60_9ARCH|nr:amidohydrolase family protein [Candidatus Nitrosocosmicus franklandus]VFJ14667.1 L-hydantoinase [Candidatus Nitrosocosmicus franklandus]
MGGNSSNSSCDLLIRNANIVIPKMGIIKSNILIENGKIKELTNSIDNVSCDRSIDVNEKYVLPGLIDPHVHYGVFSPIELASETESRSAAVGGVTTIMRMLRVYEPYTQKISKHLHASAGNHFIDYSIHASILNPNQIQEISYLYDMGIRSFKLYMNLGSTDNRILMDMNPSENLLLPENVHVTDDLCSKVLFHSSKLKNSVVLVHAEDHETCSKLIEEKKEEQSAKKIDDNKNKQSRDENPLKTWSECRPTTSESTAIKKIMNIGRQYGTNLYFVHIGSNDALDTILYEKQAGGCNVYVETCPHYLTHSVDYNNLIGKVVPPLRTKNDVASLWNAIKNGLIDTIGTDHVANTLDLKLGNQNDVWTALAGFPGVATMLPVLLHYGVIMRQLSLVRLAEITSYNTSRIFGLYPKKGTIQKGSDADLVVIDLDITKKVSPDILQSSSDYTIYDGYQLQGWPVLTISRGKIIMENGNVYNENKGHGEFVKLCLDKVY